MEGTFSYTELMDLDDEERKAWMKICEHHHKNAEEDVKGAKGKSRH